MIGLVSKYKILSSGMFLISFLVFISTPFVIKIASEDLLHKAEIIDNKSRILEFSNSLLVDFRLKNAGLLKMHACTISVRENPSSSLFSQLKDFLLPKNKVEIKIDKPLLVNESKKIFRIFENHNLNPKMGLKIKISCN